MVIKIHNSKEDIDIILIQDILETLMEGYQFVVGKLKYNLKNQKGERIGSSGYNND